jgi:hypothetical protein
VDDEHEVDRGQELDRGQKVELHGVQELQDLQSFLPPPELRTVSRASCWLPLEPSTSFRASETSRAFDRF